jgi:hypothetical protein
MNEEVKPRCSRIDLIDVTVSPKKMITGRTGAKHAEMNGRKETVAG